MFDMSWSRQCDDAQSSGEMTDSPSSAVLDRRRRLRRVVALSTAALVISTSTLWEPQRADAAGCVAVKSTPYTYWRPFPSGYGGPPPWYAAGLQYRFERTSSYGGCGGHTGTDWDMHDHGSRTYPVYATYNSHLRTKVSNDPNYGKYSRLLSDNATINTIYAHLSSHSYSVGAYVPRAAAIGYSGGTGAYAAGAVHIHVAMATTWNGWTSSNTHFFNSRTFLANANVNWISTSNPNDPYSSHPSTLHE